MHKAANRSFLQHRTTWVLVCCALIAGLALWGQSLAGLIQINAASLKALHAVLHDNRLLEGAKTGLEQVSQANCRALWLSSRTAEELGDHPARDRALERLVDCKSNRIPLVAGVASSRSDWAEKAIAAHPEEPAAWFWLARLYSPEDPQTAITLYRQGLVLQPTDAFAWLALGDLLAEGDPHAAIEAYLQSCYNGDPGSNGCYRAGYTAETLGDFEAAITYYRISRWSVAQERADELAQKSSNNPQ